MKKYGHVGAPMELNPIPLQVVHTCYRHNSYLTINKFELEILLPYIEE